MHPRTTTVQGHDKESGVAALGERARTHPACIAGAPTPLSTAGRAAGAHRTGGSRGPGGARVDAGLERGPFDGAELAPALGAQREPRRRALGRCSPPGHTADQICAIVTIACEAPQDSGRATTHWTQEELAREAVKRGVVASISPDSVGRSFSPPRTTSPSRLSASSTTTTSRPPWPDPFAGPIAGNRSRHEPGWAPDFHRSALGRIRCRHSDASRHSRSSSRWSALHRILVRQHIPDLC